MYGQQANRGRYESERGRWRRHTPRRKARKIHATPRLTIRQQRRQKMANNSDARGKSDPLQEIDGTAGDVRVGAAAVPH